MSERIKQGGLAFFMTIACFLPVTAFSQTLPAFPASFPNGRVGQPYPAGPSLVTSGCGPTGSSSYDYFVPLGVPGLAPSIPSPGIEYMFAGTPTQAGHYGITLELLPCDGTFTPLKINSYEIDILPASASPSKVGVFENGLWFLDYSGIGQLTSSDIIGWGQAGDIPVVGDWNGSGTSKIGVFRNGLWFLDTRGDHVLTSNQIVGWGQAGDIPVIGDWNGTGTSKIGVFRPSLGLWFLDLQGTHQLTQSGIIGWGQSGDIPVVGDWDRDGTTKIGVFRNGTWFLDQTGTHQLTASGIISFGQPGDVPQVGDWTGSGFSRIGVYRNGTWYRDLAGNNLFATATVFTYGGFPGDIPVVGDWSNGGSVDIGFFQKGSWYLLHQIVVWGQPTDQPVVGRW
jgi:hypothetical protein